MESVCSVLFSALYSVKTKIASFLILILYKIYLMHINQTYIYIFLYIYVHVVGLGVVSSQHIMLSAVSEKDLAKKGTTLIHIFQTEYSEPSNKIMRLKHPQPF